MTIALAESRPAAVDRTISDAKAIIAAAGVTPDSLQRVLRRLQRLAEQRHLWTADEFAPSEPPERQARYLIREDDDRSFALYLNVMRPRQAHRPAQPHDLGLHRRYRGRRMSLGSRSKSTMCWAPGTLLPRASSTAWSKDETTTKRRAWATRMAPWS